MCNTCSGCWNEEISAFKNKDHWDSVDLGITQRLAGDKLIRIPGLITEGSAPIEILRCLQCHTEWKLCLPDRFHSGFLKRV